VSEELIASPPTVVVPAEARLRAAELYIVTGDVRRAAALLREVQRLIQRYPRTTAAAHARAALEKLKT
jgi:hypothetical protein